MVELYLILIKNESYLYNETKTADNFNVMHIPNKISFLQFNSDNKIS